MRAIYTLKRLNLHCTPSLLIILTCRYNFYDKRGKIYPGRTPLPLLHHKQELTYENRSEKPGTGANSYTGTFILMCFDQRTSI